jgi:signal peptidase I
MVRSKENKPGSDSTCMEAAPAYITYSGPSMNPTLKSGDLLEVAPYSGRTIQRGDVILFYREEEDRKIVHDAVTLVRNA